MRNLILDLETFGLDAAKEWLDDEPIVAPSNWKDPQKIADYIAKAEAERFEKLALDPDCCRIVAMGFVDAGLPLDPTVYLMHDEREEKQQLELFWKVYTQQSSRLISFYGLKFDLPVLMRRSMYLDVKCPILNVDRYRSEHVDLWQKLSFNGAITAHSLKFYAKRLGIGTLDKVDGAQIGELVKADTKESWQEIYDHVLSDVGLTHALAMRLGYVPRIAEAAA